MSWAGASIVIGLLVIAAADVRAACVMAVLAILLWKTS